MNDYRRPDATRHVRLPTSRDRKATRHYEYKVVTQRDGLWSGRFDAEALSLLLNRLGEQGWRLVESSASSIPALLTRQREELLLVFEREVES